MTEQELKHRINNALIILQDCGSFKVGELTFNTTDVKSFSVTGWTLKTELKHVTKRSALIELEEIKSLFWKMVQASPELSVFVGQRQFEFNLGYDYGMGRIGICSEINGQINWEIETKE